MQRLKISNEGGMSLVEATIILMVLATLTATIAPSIADYVNDAEGTKAKEDVEAIGTGILRLLKDTGSRCLREAGTTDCTKTNREDLLVSAGNEPLNNSATDVTIPDLDAIQDGTTALNWLPDSAAPTSGQRGTVDEHLIQNTVSPAYTAAGFTGGGGPRMKLGWRGAYLNGPVTGDPWGYMYQANTVFTTVATDATDGGAVNTQEGLKHAGWQRNVMVLTPGANGTVETSFGAAGVGVVAAGDDVIYVLRGSTR